MSEERQKATENVEKDKGGSIAKMIFSNADMT